MIVFNSETSETSISYDNKNYRTEIGTPEPPDPPVFIHHESHDHDGEIHVKVTPLEKNRKGPISSYRIVVIDETDPSPFHEENLYNWTLAQEEGVNYWIAAELKPGKINIRFVIAGILIARLKHTS